MAKKFVKVTGLNKVFDVSTDGVSLDVSTLKSSVSETADDYSILFIKATEDDETYGYKANDNYVWSRGILVGGGGSVSDLVIETTYSDLKDLRDNEELVPGVQYRITDYQCTTTTIDTRSAGHQFDIIVMADSASILNENAKAIKHEDDEYFANCNLEAWELKYCIDNDTNRFAWADEENGKGVIWFMKDEWDNECSYDFKNIQFKRYERKEFTATEAGVSTLDTSWTENVRYKIVKGTIPTDYAPVTQSIDEQIKNFLNYNGYENFGILENYFTGWDTEELVLAHFMTAYKSTSDVKQITQIESSIVAQFDSDSFTWAYTFGYDSDSTVIGEKSSNNIIKPYRNGEDEYALLCLNNILFYADEDECLRNIFGTNCLNMTFGRSCRDNSFGNVCCYISAGFGYGANSFGNECYYNNFGNHCLNNSFGNSCGGNNSGNGYNYNNFGNHCNYNSFGNECEANSFGNYCNTNSFGNECDNNSFGNYCNTNSFGNECDNNSFGNDCYNNSFGNDCLSNTFGNECCENAGGDYCAYNSFGNGCYNIKFGLENTIKGNYRYIIVETGNSFIYLNATHTIDDDNIFQYITIKQGFNTTGEYVTINNDEINQTIPVFYTPILDLL